MNYMMTGVRSHFSASHTGQDGRMHGHSYEVWAYWPSDGGLDQVEMQDALDLTVGTNLDHRVLPSELASMEAMAEKLMELLGCESVKLERPVEGLSVIAQAKVKPVNVYRQKFQAVCPKVGSKIDYELELYTTEMVMVERIQAVCADMTEGYHETIADHLFSQLGGAQVLRAHHHGTDIETRRA